MSVASSKSSGLKAAGTYQIQTGAQLVNSLQVNTDGTNAATVTVYDNAAGDNSGTILCQLKTPGATLSQTIVFTFPIKADLGLTMIVSGTGSGAILGYGAS